MKEKRVNFEKALTIMEELLKGKSEKEAAYEADLPRQRVFDVKNMFPLFLGLPRKNKHHED